MDTLDTLLSRASASALREPAPVGHELEQVLQAGLRAPDHGRLRPWHFVLIRGAARATWAATILAAMRARDPKMPQPLLDRQQARLTSTPLIIALGVRLQTGHKIPEIEQTLSVGAAAMNMLNALHALGFGGLWVSGPNSYDPAIVAALGLAPTDRLAGFLYVGTPADPRPQLRHPALAEHVSEWTGATAPLPAMVSGEAG
jgi:nitroreductase